MGSRVDSNGFGDVGSICRREDERPLNRVFFNPREAGVKETCADGTWRR